MNGNSGGEMFPPCGGEMGARVRAFDWSRNPLGPVSGWPREFKAAVDLCLSVEFPMILYGGPELIVIYNDYYRDFLDAKFSWALGRPCREVWSELWEGLEPVLARQMTGGEGVRFQEQRVDLYRNDILQEGYFDYTLSPIRSVGGQTSGIFCAATETTWRIVADRRSKALLSLSDRLVEGSQAEDVCALAADVLASAALDLPFCLIYLSDRGVPGGTRLAGSMGVSILPGTHAIPPLPPEDGQLIADARAYLADLGAVPVAEVISRMGPAVVVPLRQVSRNREPVGMMVAGISPSRPFDSDYRDFIRKIAGHIASSILDIRAKQADINRAEASAELDRAKSVFFSNISHEFRTPLTLIQGPVNDIIEDKALALPEHHRRGIEIVQGNARRLLKLVNALLDFSRAEAGRLQVAFELTDVGAWTAELVSHFDSLCRKAGLTLSVVCQPLPGPVYVDREMWEKIVLNLMSNAFKFTRSGTIRVSVTPGANGMELRVADTGIGIPATELPRIFERFHRVQSSGGRTGEGTGIGLAIVQEYVKLHGGEIEVVSGEGQGSEFTVKLPYGYTHLPPRSVSGQPDGTACAVRDNGRNTETYVDEALEWLKHEDDATGSQAGDDGAAIARNGYRILIVEDNPDMRNYVRRILERTGYGVTAVGDGIDALTAVRDNPLPDLVLTDVMMPRMDGFELLRCLRAEPRTAGINIVLLSARAGNEARIEGLSAGADDYLVKPFDARELVARIDSAIRLRQMRQEAVLRDYETREQLGHAPAAALPPIAQDAVQLALQAGRVGTWETDLITGSVARSPSHDAIFGYIPPIAEWTPATFFSHIEHEDRDRIADLYDAARKGTLPLNFICRIHRVDGELRWIEVQSSQVRDGAGKVIRLFGIVMDITERKLAEQRIQFLAYNDPLTGLPNRALAGEEVRNAIASARKDGGSVALLYLDIDAFKVINDSLGHSIGDRLLQAVAVRLAETVRPGQIVCRLGGDEFAIVLPSPAAGCKAATALATTILERMEAPIEIDGHALSLSITIGISTFPDHGDDFETLHRKADLAMYAAKLSGRNTFQFYDERMSAGADERLRLGNRLRQALEAGEFELYYQPQFDIASGRVLGAEALIRWNHPELGLVPPGKFIPLAEDNGLIIPIGEWVIRRACTQIAQWRGSPLGG